MLQKTRCKDNEEIKIHYLLSIMQSSFQKLEKYMSSTKKDAKSKNLYYLVMLLKEENESTHTIICI